MLRFRVVRRKELAHGDASAVKKGAMSKTTIPANDSEIKARRERRKSTVTGMAGI